MPINKKMMDSLKKEYWEEKWEDIYYALENKNKNKKKKSTNETLVKYAKSKM